MDPFKVTFRFISPVVTDSEYPIHLDALIAWAAVNEAEAAGSDDAWAEGDDLSFALDSAENEHGRVWKTSRLIFTPLTERVQMNMIRKSDPEKTMEDYDAGHFKHPRTVNSINTNSGQYRAYQMFIAHQWIEKAEAWGVGDIEVVKILLSRLRNVGKKGSNGFGRIESFDVEPCSEADVQWRLRVLPHGMEGVPGVTYAPGFHCLRAPYWENLKQVEAMEPII